jgi:hypothetical protein
MLPKDDTERAWVLSWWGFCAMGSVIALCTAAYHIAKLFAPYPN